jgi:hypothetical protein
MRRINLFIIAISILSVHWLGAYAAEQFQFKIIVNSQNSVQTIDQKTLSNLFLKKTKFWESGQIAQPVDLEANSSIRKEFSTEILDRPIEAVKNYWQQMIFSGREVPPPEFASDQAIIRYVKGHENAIGYISQATDASGVKIITIR